MSPISWVPILAAKSSYFSTQGGMPRYPSNPITPLTTSLKRCFRSSSSASSSPSNSHNLKKTPVFIGSAASASSSTSRRTGSTQKGPFLACAEPSRFGPSWPTPTMSPATTAHRQERPNSWPPSPSASARPWTLCTLCTTPRTQPWATPSAGGGVSGDSHSTTFQGPPCWPGTTSTWWDITYTPTSWVQTRMFPRSTRAIRGAFARNKSGRKSTSGSITTCQCFTGCCPWGRDTTTSLRYSCWKPTGQSKWTQSLFRISFARQAANYYGCSGATTCQCGFLGWARASSGLSSWWSSLWRGTGWPWTSKCRTYRTRQSSSTTKWTSLRRMGLMSSGRSSGRCCK